MILLCYFSSFYFNVVPTDLLWVNMSQKLKMIWVKTVSGFKIANVNIYYGIEEWRSTEGMTRTMGKLGAF